VAWLTLISSAPGTEGYVSAEEANKLTASRGAAPSDVLFDPKGDVGRAYGAQTTPHMYVIKGDGTLLYMGGIDDKPTTRLDDLKTAKNFVDAALSEVAAGKPVSVTTSRVFVLSLHGAGAGTLPASASGDRRVMPPWRGGFCIRRRPSRARG
jgi:hypothetical protein